MICPYCKSEVEDSAKKCPACGADTNPVVISRQVKKLGLAKIMAICSVLALLIVFLTLVFPIVENRGYEISGKELVDASFEYGEMPGLGIGLAYIFAGAALLCALIALKFSVVAIGNIIFILTGTIMLFVGMDEMLDYAASGFTFYIIMAVATIVTSLVTVLKKK